MKQPLFVRNTIVINAPASKVWDALVNPEQTKKYMFGCETVYTTIDPNNSAIPDVPGNYLTVTYDLSENNGQTTLTVTQGDYSNVAEGDKRYHEAESAGGWQPILVQIKELVEV